MRLIDPTLPEGATLPPPGPAGWFDPNGNPIPEILNHYVNFGWEYVWHCHILSHEEMDFMHSLVFAVRRRRRQTSPPPGPANAITESHPELDRQLHAGGRFTIQRATNASFTSGLTTVFTPPGQRRHGADW